MSRMAVISVVAMAVALVARADGALPEEVRRYYEAWEYLASSTTPEERRAALEPDGPPELGRAREAIRLVEAAEIPFSVTTRGMRPSARWLLPLPRYELGAVEVAPDGAAMVVSCRATGAPVRSPARPGDDPNLFRATVPAPAWRHGLGTELHQWVRTRDGWRRRSPTPILTD